MIKSNIHFELWNIYYFNEGFELKNLSSLTFQPKFGFYEHIEMLVFGIRCK
jgi:hypothetical protein